MSRHCFRSCASQTRRCNRLSRTEKVIMIHRVVYIIYIYYVSIITYYKGRNHEFDVKPSHLRVDRLSVRFVYVCTYTRVFTYTHVYNMRCVTVCLTFPPTSQSVYNTPCILLHTRAHARALYETLTFLPTFAFFPPKCEARSI